MLTLLPVLLIIWAPPTTVSTNSNYSTKACVYKGKTLSALGTWYFTMASNARVFQSETYIHSLGFGDGRRDIQRQSVGAFHPDFVCSYRN
jgi:hypothetical protein